MKLPAPLLTVLCHDAGTDGDDVGVCAGFERGRWRQAALVESVMEWLPEFALSHAEVESIGAHNAMRMVRRAATAVYRTEKYGRRGEFGEVLLHMILRQVFGTIPAVSKIFYKSAVNKTVEGFDAVHVVVSGEDLELWIGETKFYKSLPAAVRDVCEEIVEHLETDYLRDEFLLIRNKIDPSWPHSDRLKELLNENTSLDEIFARAAIPVLLTYDSNAVGAFAGDLEEYRQTVRREFEQGWAKMRPRLDGQYESRFGSKMNIKVHIVLMPLMSKKALQKALHLRMKELQG